jgi:capsular exopolysaccharide synthesis family protein
MRNAILGIALGAVLGIALAFLLEALDTRVRSTRELERRVGLPLLARIPEPPRWAQRSRRLVMLADPTGVEAEAFRVLRTNLDFFNMEHGARTIMVTSALEQEGKSTTVANLAVALSRSGQRVILVDLDLRRPALDGFFNFQGRPGLTDVALGRARLAPLRVEDRDATQGSLEVLTSGPLPADAGEFVGSRQLASILAELRERADIVLIDSPPLLAVGDAIALSAKVDGVIVLTRLGVLRRKTVEELRRVLTNVPAAKIGFVVSGAQLEQDQRYGYGYGYGYGGSYTPPAAKGRRR